MTPSAMDPWSYLSPPQVHVMLEDFTGWWMCGGWSLDLWLGRVTRPHGDTDIGCLRADVDRLCRHLWNWEIYTAHKGTLTPIDGPVPAAVHSLWMRQPGSSTWDLQVMIEESDGARWTYRRDPRITRPVHAITWRTPAGLRVLQPEIQLLYKAKLPRARDRVDFARVMPRLDARARDWLVRALETLYPGHVWLRRLREDGVSRGVGTRRGALSPPVTT